MTRRLLGLSGSAEGLTLSLDSSVHIGRDDQCDVSLTESWVSREHCRIDVDQDTLFLVDLGSHNGTLLNGVSLDPSGRRAIQHGDRISLGTVNFVVLEGDDVDSLVEATWVEDGARRPHRVTLELPASAQFAPALSGKDESWRSLLDFASELASLPGPQILHRRLADVAFELTPATTMGLFLGSETARPDHVFTDVREKGDHPDRLSRSIVQRVLDEKTALRFESVEELPKSASLAVRPPQTVLGVPILHGEDVLGCFYLDSFEPAVLSEEHLRLAILLASIVSPALAGQRRVLSLQRENDRLRNEALVRDPDDILGASSAIRRLQILINKAAASDATVSIVGESGTGKELVARALHRRSARSGGPLVVVDCTTLNRELLESELFGYEKGAFTGANVLKRGKLELADGGTLFLDEVGELPVELQAKFLRVLQEKQFERLGGARTIDVDVRVVTATNRDLRREVAEGRFREDLFYRIQVVQIELPPLRDRDDDVLVLAKFFVDKFAKASGRRVEGLDASVLETLKRHRWPGNIRELSNVVERAVVLGETPKILRDDLPEYLLELSAPSASADVQSATEEAGYHEQVNGSKRKILLSAIRANGGNITAAAKQLALHPNYVHRLVRNLGLREELSSD